MTLCVEYDIVWFQITEYNVLFMQILKRQQDLTQVIPRYFFSEPPILLETPTHVTARCVVQQQEQFFRGLKRILKPHNKRMFSIG